LDLGGLSRHGFGRRPRRQRSALSAGLEAQRGCGAGYGPDGTPDRLMNRFLIPFGLFIVVVGFLAVGLTLNPRELPSPLVGKTAPDFSLPQLHDPAKVISSNDLKGQVWLLNFWASWCGGCKDEHPVLIHLAQSGEVPIYGMDYKDQRSEALAWLKEWGNPYQIVAVDEPGRAGINYGVYGVPETYVIDKQGIIRYKQIGPLREDILKGKILPLVRELQNQ
jgi:cytochrome c biogenesis protein CcmG, thiol:disulfide interchange protein DsbE